MKTNQFKTNLSRALGNYLKNSKYIGDIMRNGVATFSNPKWEDFEETGIRRKEALVNNSVSHGLVHQDNTASMATGSSVRGKPTEPMPQGLFVISPPIF